MLSQFHPETEKITYPINPVNPVQEKDIGFSAVIYDKYKTRRGFATTSAQSLMWGRVILERFRNQTIAANNFFNFCG